ncbi:hypothetical protein IJG78_03805 [Candidatus Saccharibacteria bacterium]|nr:hypothetical protein [Candidatus Saccharibacteria bacterium]
MGLICDASLFLSLSTGSTKARRYPLSYIYSGYYVWGRGTLYFQGENGYWYSTVASSSTNAYRLSISDPTLNPQDNGGNMNGFPLRCTFINDYCFLQATRTNYSSQKKVSCYCLQNKYTSCNTEFRLGKYCHTEHKLVFHKKHDFPGCCILNTLHISDSGGSVEKYQ